MKRLKRAFWFAVALVFLVEAWLWDTLQPVIARLVGLIDWHGFRAWISDRIARLPPWLTLLVFAIPDILVLPVKLGGLWLSARGHVVTGMTIFIVAKLAGAAATLFLFEICRPKLIQLWWFARLHDWFGRARAWAREQTAPARIRLAAIRNRVMGERGRFLRILRWLRRRRDAP